MRVKELINQLRYMDQEAEVVFERPGLPGERPTIQFPVMSVSQIEASGDGTHEVVLTSDPPNA